jgi:acetoacetate decarboxylase
MAGSAAPYPPAPWRLFGRALLTPATIAAAAVRASLPASLKPVCLRSGRCLGGLYAARYSGASSLPYSEVLAAALVRSGLAFGLWIVAIYVDDAASVAGGREIWGLEKALARFDWSDRDVSVTTGDGGVFSVRWRNLGRLWRQRATIRTYVERSGRAAPFIARARARLRPVWARWQVPYRRRAGRAAALRHGGPRRSSRRTASRVTAR